ncbi:MAG: LysR family transcriptional regulator [Eggerthellaceae bacterium]|nr:LysR family transcriptional regulator [Eggerthellaceae bacterium]
MELFQLEQFTAIARSGSMAKAAKRLFVSRAALSQNLKRLETELGCKLFEREHNGLVITPFGEIVLEHAQNISNEIAVLQDEVEHEKRRGESLVRIGHFALPQSHFKMPHLAQELSSLTFAVEIADPSTLSDGLENDVYDLIMVPSSTKLPAGAQSVEIEAEHACLSVPRSSKLYGRKSVRLVELAGEKLFLTDSLAGMSEWYGQLAAASGVDPADIEVVESGRYLNAMSGNDRCHFSTDQMVNFFGLGNGRVAVRIEDDIATRTVVAAYMKDTRAPISPVIEYLRTSRGAEYGSYDIFPYLMFPGQIKNLSFA